MDETPVRSGTAKGRKKIKLHKTAVREFVNLQVRYISL